MTTTIFPTIDSAALVTATGGAAAPPVQQEAPPETTGQMVSRTAREYMSACVNGAGQALLFGGKPKSFKDAATTAGMGCVMGVGTRALDQLTGAMFGTSGE